MGRRQRAAEVETEIEQQERSVVFLHGNNFEGTLRPKDKLKPDAKRRAQIGLLKQHESAQAKRAAQVHSVALESNTVESQNQ